MPPEQQYFPDWGIGTIGVLYKPMGITQPCTARSRRCQSEPGSVAIQDITGDASILITERIDCSIKFFFLCQSCTHLGRSDQITPGQYPADNQSYNDKHYR